LCLYIANMPSTYKKDKPWDTDDIDKWKVSRKTSLNLGTCSKFAD